MLYACIGFILISSIEGTIIATVMPEIVGDLGGFEFFSWVFTGYLLTQAVIIPIYGRLADVYDRRRMLLVATALFALGSVLCGCAWNMLSLVIFRVAQGIGAGELVPVSQTVVGDLYTPVERARIAGYLSSRWAIGSIIGPLLGAFLIAHTSWLGILDQRADRGGGSAHARALAQGGGRAPCASDRPWWRRAPNNRQRAGHVRAR